MEVRAARPGASDAELAAITRRLDALAAGVSESGSGGGASGRPSSRGRVRFDGGAPGAPQQRSRTRSRSRSRSRSTSRARMAAGGAGREEEEDSGSESGTPRRTSLFAEAATSKAAPRAPLPAPPGRFTGTSLYSAADDEAGISVEARLRASASVAASRAGAARRGSARDAAPAPAAVRRAAPAPAPAPRRSNGAAPPVSMASYDAASGGGEGGPLPQTAPDRAAALGQALAEIVRARNAVAAPAPGGQGAEGGAGGNGGAGGSAAAWSSRLATLRSAEYSTGPARVAASYDVNQLNSALDEQGKFRPNAAAQAAREEQWAQTAAGPAAALAARRAAGNGARSTSRGRSGPSPPTSGGAQSLIRRTASRDAVESAGVSVVRALSGGMAASASASATAPSPRSAEEELGVNDPDNGSRAPQASAPVSRPTPSPAAAPPVSRPTPSPVPAAPTPTGENFPLYYNSDPAAAGPPLPPLGGGVGVADGGAMRLIAGYADGSLRVWRASDGAMLARVRRAHVGAVRAAAVLAGGAVLVTAGDSAASWRQAKPSREGLVDDSDNEVDELAPPPDGTEGPSEPAPRGALRVWTLQAQAVQLCATLLPNGPESGGAVTALAVLDARRLASASDAGNVTIWNVPGRSCDLVLRAASGSVRALAALPAAELAAAGEDRIVRIYGTWDGSLEHELHGHAASINALCPLEGGVQLVSGDDGGALRIWHVEEGVCLATIKAAHSPGRVAALAELGGGRLASAGSDGLLALWQRPKEGLREAATRWVAAGAAGQRRLGAATPAGPTAVLRLGTTAHAAAACSDGTLRLFRAADGDAVAMLLPDDVAEVGDEGYAGDVAPPLTALALAGGAPPPSDTAPPSRAACAPRVRDRLWCFNGRLC